MTRKWTDKDDQMRSDAMANKWTDFARVAKTRPYVQLMAVGDSRDDPECTALDKIIVRFDDPWLKRHYPPHRKGCRCSARSLSDAQIQRSGLIVRARRTLP